MSKRRPTRFQRNFAVAYLQTGIGAVAAREAGYRGKFPAQAAYKLLKRPGTVKRIKHWQQFERLVVRSSLLRVLHRITRVLEREDVPLEIQKKAGWQLLDVAAALHLTDDRVCEMFKRHLRLTLPPWRRLYYRPWEQRNTRDWRPEPEG